MSLDIDFWLTDPKKYLKAPSAPIYTNFKGGARAQKREFLFNIFQKVPKNVFFFVFACFFQKFDCDAGNLVNMGYL